MRDMLGMCMDGGWWREMLVNETTLSSRRHKRCEDNRGGSKVGKVCRYKSEEQFSLTLLCESEGCNLRSSLTPSRDLSPEGVLEQARPTWRRVDTVTHEDKRQYHENIQVKVGQAVESDVE
jgi:hypothetical protein